MGLPCRTVWDFKDAAFDKGAERVDAVRAMMASRLPRTHERLSDLASGVTLNGLASARDERLEQLRSAVVASSRIIHGTSERLTGLSDAVHWNITKEATLENVRTLGIGLLDRTEAILEVLLPRSSGFGTSSSSSGMSPSEEEWQRMLDRLGKVPSPISVEEVRTFAVRVSSSATLRFTVVCTQNSASLVQHLQRADIRRILQRIHWTEAQQALKEAARVRSGDAIATASVRVAQAAYVSCEELLGERFALRAFGHVAHVWRSSSEAEAAKSADDQSEQKPSIPVVTKAKASVKDQASTATPTPSSPSSSRRSRSPSRDTEGPQMRLIIKNSFLEFDEEPEEDAKNWLRTKRRCRSLDLNGPSMRLGVYEPYVLTVDCFSGDGEGGSSASQTMPSSRRRYSPAAADRGRSSSRGRSNSHTNKEQETQPAPEPEGAVGSSAPAPVVPSPRSEPCPCPAAEPTSRVVSAPQREEGTDTSPGASDAEEPKATVLVRNLPKDAVWRDLTERLDALGFACKYEFAYLPRDFTHGVGLGYALVGMKTIEHGEALIRSLDGTASWAPDGGEALRATWSDPQRTIAEHVERYRNSPVMHSSIPDDYKPALFRQGVRVPFPAPTKALRPPRIRQNKVLAHNPRKSPQVPVAAQ